MGKLKARITWRINKRINTLKQDLAVRWMPVQKRGDLFDISFWPWLEPVTSESLGLFIASLPAPSRNTWTLDLTDLNSPLDEATACLQAHGAWPISFSYPRALNWPESGPRTFLSEIVPGMPYSFTAEDAYMEQYGRAHYAVTCRKRGWDCFRHVEIFAAGSVPLMVDAEDIPRFSMVHYPKRAMQLIVNDVKATGNLPDEAGLMALREFVGKHLTSAAMARYMLTMTGLEDAERILFVDKSLAVTADYQSVLALIGLKQLRGTDCHVLYPTDYVYEDTKHPTHTLYGRGFGYSKVLSPTNRSVTERPSRRGRGRQMRLSDYDALVVGSITRNGPLGYRLLDEFPSSRTIWIHGEDQPPSPREMYFLRRAGTHLFVRAIPEDDRNTSDCES